MKNIFAIVLFLFLEPVEILTMGLVDAALTQS